MPHSSNDSHFLQLEKPLKMIIDERGLVLNEDITKGRENSPIPAVVPIDVVDSIFGKLCPDENQALSTIATLF